MKLHKQRPTLSINWQGCRYYAQRLLKSLIPSLGNIVFTVFTVSMLLWAQGAGALPFSRAPLAASSTSTIPYQGRLASANGSPISASLPMQFRLYNTATAGTPLWAETWSGTNSVQVQQGLFNVMLGSLNAVPQPVIASNTSLWLGISIGSDAEMTPRPQLGSVPYATQALTVPDASITNAKLLDGSVNSSKLADSSIATNDLANGSVTQLKAPGLVAGPANNTRIAHGQAMVIRVSNSTLGGIYLNISDAGFTQAPTAVCSVAGQAGFDWACHVEYETKDEFSIWAQRIDGSMNWTSVPVRWIAVGN